MSWFEDNHINDCDLYLSESNWNNFLGFKNHLNAINMEKEIDSWCIKITEENKKEVGKWYGNGQDYDCTLNAFYGIKRNGNKNGDWDPNVFSKIITTEEFYQKIGLIKENKELEIEIW